MKKRIVIIGSTGSIGTQALDIVGDYPEKFEIVGLAAYKNIDLLREQIEKYSPKEAVLIDEAKAEELNTNLIDGETIIGGGKDGVLKLVSRKDVDIVLMALVGIAGLEPTLKALKQGKTVALANKEVLVAGGHIVNRTIEEYGGNIIPIDSEHSAIFQSLQECRDIRKINRLILTASGGPFRGYSLKELRKVTPEEALKHPNWDMGNKISIDSATLMNKGLEVIEAKWLFNMEPHRIEVIVHPESIIHSMVEFIDGAIIGQLGPADMRIPILYALTYPERFKTQIDTLDFRKTGKLTFEEPDWDNFPCLGLAYRAMEVGGTMPVVLNAANEVAVDLFLKGRLTFLDIPKIIENTMDAHTSIHNPDIATVMEVDRIIRDTLYKKEGVL